MKVSNRLPYFILLNTLPPSPSCTLLMSLITLLIPVLQSLTINTRTCSNRAFTSAFSFPTPMVMPLNNFVGKFAASYGLAFTYAAIKHVVWHMKGEETTFEHPKIETFDIEDWTHGWPTMMKELSGHMREAGKSALELSLGMLGHMHEAVRNFEMPKIQLPKFPVFNHFDH